MRRFSVLAPWLHAPQPGVGVHAGGAFGCDQHHGGSGGTDGGSEWSGFSQEQGRKNPWRSKPACHLDRELQSKNGILSTVSRSVNQTQRCNESV